MAKKRSTKEVYDIVKDTYQLIANGLGYNEIRYILHDKYNISYAHADKYHTKALDILRKEYGKDLIDIKNQSLLNYNKQIKDIEIDVQNPAQKHDLIIKVKKQMDKIKGLEVIKHEHSGNINTKTELKIIGVDVDNTNTEKDTNSNTTA